VIILLGLLAWEGTGGRDSRPGYKGRISKCKNQNSTKKYLSRRALVFREREEKTSIWNHSTGQRGGGAVRKSVGRNRGGEV